MKNIMSKKQKLGASLTALAFSLIVSVNVRAQSCIVPPTCAELGYTNSASECATKALKCPFDNSKYYCLTADELADLGGGSGSCDVPNLGDILFSDMSCGSSPVDGKRAIGIVFEPDRRLAIALNTTTAYWSTTYFDLPGLTNYSSSTTALGDWSGKSNTITVLTYCAANGYSCPAFEYVKNYATLGTQMGDWYLPSMAELNEIYTNKTALNTALTKANGITLPNSYHWSSSEYDYNYAWYQYFNNGYVSNLGKLYNGYVRPVLAF